MSHLLRRPRAAVQAWFQPEAGAEPPVEAADGASPPRTSPLILDLRDRSDDGVADSLRDLRRRLPAGTRRVVVDLGPRRWLPAEAIDEVVFTHRTLCERGGRCAVIADPALSVQISISHPEGILWAGSWESALALLGRLGAPIEVRREVSRGRMSVALEGGLEYTEPPGLDEVVAFAAPGREIVLDLDGLRFVDVGLLEVITRSIVRSRLAGARVRVDGASPQVVRLAYRLGWQDQLPGLAGDEPHEPATPRARGRLHPVPDPVADRRRLRRRAEADALLADGTSAVIVTNGQGRITGWNAAAHRLYGWTPAEAIGRPIHELTVAPDQELAVQRLIAQARRHGSWEGRLFARRRDGSTFLAEVRAASVEDAYGRLTGMVGVFAEIAAPAEGAA